MQKALQPSSVIPPGFAIVSSSIADDGATILVRSTSPTSRCPRCGSVSGRVHSRYRRQISDLPLAGRPVKLMVDVRRFRCEAVRCGQRIFAERFADGVVAPWARRTGRLEALVHHLGLALGGRPAASFARRLMLPVSNDTLLRVVRRRGRTPSPAPTVIGIDDWAWRRNHRYGTIICDLERRRPIRLLPDREPATAQAWLAEQPQVAIVARDRGGAYARAAAKALPNAVQVADRWHLMENASRAFLDAVRKSMRQIRCAIGAMTIKPELLTAAERLQYEGYLHREQTNAAILALSKDGVAIKEIVRRTGHSRGTVRRVLRGKRSDVFRTRETSLEACLPWLDQELLAALRPYLTLSPSFRAATGGTVDPNHFATIADAEVKLARDRAFLVVEKIDGLPEADTFWAERLDALTGLLKQVFDLYATVGEANASFDPSAMQRPSIPPHAQNRRHAEWARLYDLIWRGWAAIDATDPPASRHWVERWRRVPYLGFRRLALAATTQSPHFSAAEKLEALLHV